MINAVGSCGRIPVDSVAGGSDILRFVAGTTRTPAVGYAAEKKLRRDLLAGRRRSGCSGAGVAAHGALDHGCRRWGEIFGHHRPTVQRAGGTAETKTWKGYDYPGLATVADALEAFAQDCEGGASFPVTPEQIHHGTAVLEAIVESAETGARIQVAR